MTRLDDLISELKALESPHDRAAMARFGINANNALGITAYEQMFAVADGRMALD